MKDRLTRRGFLRLTAVVSAGAVLAACGVTGQEDERSVSEFSLDKANEALIPWAGAKITFDKTGEAVVANQIGVLTNNEAENKPIALGTQKDNGSVDKSIQWGFAIAPVIDSDTQTVDGMFMLLRYDAESGKAKAFGLEETLSEKSESGEKRKVYKAYSVNEQKQAVPYDLLLEAKKEDDAGSLVIKDNVNQRTYTLASIEKDNKPTQVPQGLMDRLIGAVSGAEAVQAQAPFDSEKTQEAIPTVTLIPEPTQTPTPTITPLPTETPMPSLPEGVDFSEWHNGFLYAIDSEGIAVFRHNPFKNEWERYKRPVRMAYDGVGEMMNAIPANIIPDDARVSRMKDSGDNLIPYGYLCTVLNERVDYPPFELVSGYVYEIFDSKVVFDQGWRGMVFRMPMRYGIQEMLFFKTKDYASGGFYVWTPKDKENIEKGGEVDPILSRQEITINAFFDTVYTAMDARAYNDAAGINLVLTTENLLNKQIIVGIQNNSAIVNLDDFKDNEFARKGYEGDRKLVKAWKEGESLSEQTFLNANLVWMIIP